MMRKPRIHVFISGPEIVISNSDTRPYEIVALEIEYEVTTRSIEPTLPYEEESTIEPVRVMHEREDLGITLKPGEIYKYYFGATDKLRAATLSVKINDEILRITQEFPKEVGEESEEQHGQ